MTGVVYDSNPQINAIMAHVHGELRRATAPDAFGSFSLPKPPTVNAGKIRDFSFGFVPAVDLTFGAKRT